MNILIDLGNQLVAEALCQFLVTDTSITVALKGKVPPRGFVPHILLVDRATVSHIRPHRDAKVLLIDTGMGTENLLPILLSHDVQGVLSTQTGLPLLKQALASVMQGQVWIDSGSLKALLEDKGALSKKRRIAGLTERHQEIIDHVGQGLSNKEIAEKLGLSEDTIKAHLNRIFRTLHVSSRSQLMALTLGRRDRALARSA